MLNFVTKDVKRPNGLRNKCEFDFEVDCSISYYFKVGSSIRFSIISANPGLPSVIHVIKDKPNIWARHQSFLIIHVDCPSFSFYQCLRTNEMNLRKIGKLFHVFMFGLFVWSTSYKVLAIPKTEPEKLYGGRIKFLTFIDAVSACELSLRGFMTGDEDVNNKLTDCTALQFSFLLQLEVTSKTFRQNSWVDLFVHARVPFFRI